jgi:hypothetical protein
MKITLSLSRDDLYYEDEVVPRVICSKAVRDIFGRVPELATFEFSNQPLEHSVTLDPRSPCVADNRVVVRGPNGGVRVYWITPRLCRGLVAGGIDLKQRMWFRMYEGKVK